MILNLYLNRTLNRILNLNLSEKKKKLWMEGDEGYSFPKF